MSQFRQNPITKQWVLIAPKRSARPEDYKTKSVMEGLEELDSDCVFCPGNEHKNSELFSYPSGHPWQLRIIPNKFSALETGSDEVHKGFYVSRDGFGEHEVLITRKHNEPIALQSVSTIELSLRVFGERIRDLYGNPEISYVQVFHNHGRDAGASIIHPHFQIMATPLVPPHIHSEINGCHHYFQIHGSDIYGDIIANELKWKERIVLETEHFVVLSAYASRKPFETWIVPKRQSARFEDLHKSELSHLAYVLKTVLSRLYHNLGDPPLNFYIHTMPNSQVKHSAYDEKAFRWHLTIFPRLTIWAGFEYSTGIPVNPVAPEQTAAFLRNDQERINL